MTKNNDTETTKNSNVAVKVDNGYLEKEVYISTIAVAEDSKNGETLNTVT